MKKRLIFLGMLVCLLALGLVFVSCDNGSTSGGGGGGGGIPAELVAKWYRDEACTQLEFEITADSKMIIEGLGTVDCTVKDGNLAFDVGDGYLQTYMFGYKVEGKKMTGTANGGRDTLYKK